MSFTDDINSLLGNSNPIAQELAQKIKNISDCLAAGSITAAEATDLLNDMNVEAQLVQLANDLETKVLIQQAVAALITIIQQIPGL